MQGFTINESSMKSDWL